MESRSVRRSLAMRPASVLVAWVATMVGDGAADLQDAPTGAAERDHSEQRFTQPTQPQ